MALFCVAVLVGLPRVDLLHDQTVVSHQRLISPSKLLSIRQVVHGRAHPVRAMALGHSSQFPECLLQPLAEALEALGKTDRGRLPVRVGEHEMIDHMVEGLACQGHVQARHVGEVGRAQTAGIMGLREEHLLGRPARPPAIDESDVEASATDRCGTDLDIAAEARRTGCWPASPGLSSSFSRTSSQTSAKGSCPRPPRSRPDAPARWGACRGLDTSVPSSRPCPPSTPRP